MRKPLSLAGLLLILTILACNAPGAATPSVVCTPPPCREDQVYHCPGECPGGCGTICVNPTAAPNEPIPVCTPPLCTEDEEYYCPGECPGGCGTECATPTAGGSKATPSPVTPTDAPIVQCTPPPCTGNEVYYCEAECPGGCGTQCATPTAGVQSAEVQSAAPIIRSFTANRTTILEEESVTLSWQATGGTEVSIQWVSHEAILTHVPGPLNPDGGKVTITPTGDGDITLIVGNSDGAVEAHVQILIECLYPWAPALEDPPPLASGCPEETVFGNAAQQSFENGFMVWIQAEQTIYTFYYPQGDSSYPTYGSFIDNFSEGDPESDPTIVPPAGLYQPLRGFGLLWRLDPYVRDHLGWATAPESGFEAWLQRYSGMGMHNYYTLLQDVDGTIYHLTATGGVWEVYAP